MKAYKVELLILDLENYGEDHVIYELEKPEYLISTVMSIQSKEIGEFEDDHPLNLLDQQRDYYNQLFKEEQ